MLFRVEFRDETSSIVDGRKKVLDCIRAMPGEITDIRKIYKNGITDSVLDNYKKQIYRAKNGLKI